MTRSEAPRSTPLRTVVAGVAAGSNLLAVVVAMGVTPSQAHSPSTRDEPPEHTASRLATADATYPALWLGVHESTLTPVRATQYMLRRWSPTLVTDGRFGFNTMAAVRKFQKAENLPVTGRLVTPAEWRRLYLRNAIAFGSRGNAVAAIQVTINTYWSGILGRVTVDGKFGPTMSAKIAAFQRHINRLTPGRLTVDGEVGVHTWHAIEPWSND